MSSSGYSAINDEKAPKRSNLVYYLSTAILVGIAIGVTFYLTKEHYQGSSSGSSPAPTYDPSKPYVVPSFFEASLEFHIPYFQFSEPVYVHYDAVRPAQKISYYSGMDTYINLGDKKSSYIVTPIMTELTCLESDPTPLEAVFPMMSLFKKIDGTKNITTKAYPTGIMCDQWQYTFGTPVVTNSTANLPDKNGYSGVYTFYVSAKDGTPVQFHQKGHNTVLGGSHSDEYVLDYLSVTVLPSGLDASLFQVPSGMICHQSFNPFGPTRTGVAVNMHRSNPSHDFEMLFPHGQDRRDSVFADFETSFGKEYASPVERQARQAQFHANLRFINSANRRPSVNYHLAVNHMADWTVEEKRALNGRLGGFPTTPVSGPDPKLACGYHTLSGNPLPDNFDWRPKGVVHAPKDQGTCGSCWTFGSTGTIEGQLAIKTGKLTSLSEQNLMDCTWRLGNNACGGGNDWLAFAWLLQHNNGSIASDESYGGYLNQNGFCHYSIEDGTTESPFTKKPVQEGAQLASCTHTTMEWNNVTVPTAQAVQYMNDALYTQGPLSISINATPDDFYYYAGGWYDNVKCGNTIDDLDHTVLAVGWKTYKGQKYTIVRNSWSELWGEGGYVNIAQDHNVCGAATTPMYVTLK